MPYRCCIGAARKPKEVVGKQGRPRSLTEDKIVEAALSLAGTARLETVSMRALAQQLGVPVMTIYNYVPNKDALYELVLNGVLRSVRVPSPEDGTWEDRLKRLEKDARSAMGKFPGLSFDRRGSGSAEGARLAEGVMSIFGGPRYHKSLMIRRLAVLPLTLEWSDGR